MPLKAVNCTKYSFLISSWSKMKVCSLKAHLIYQTRVINILNAFKRSKINIQILLSTFLVTCLQVDGLQMSLRFKGRVMNEIYRTEMETSSWIKWDNFSPNNLPKTMIMAEYLWLIKLWTQLAVMHKINKMCKIKWIKTQSFNNNNKKGHIK